MTIKFFCNGCGKEIWQEMTTLFKETTTIAEAEKCCNCNDCFLGMLKDPLESEKKGGEQQCQNKS